MESKIKNILDELRSGLSKVYGERLKGVFLYGSYARGEQGDESDLDILVVLSNFTGSYGTEVTRSGQLASDLSIKYGVSVSRVFVKADDWEHGDSAFLAGVRQDAIAA